MPVMLSIETIRELVDVNAIHSGLVTYSDRVQRMDAQLKQLTKHHPNQWVALTGYEGNEALFFAPSLEEVLQKIDECGFPRSEAVVKFLNTKPHKWIL